jgi:nucleoside-diphosphate-sugar epimerase
MVSYIASRRGYPSWWNQSDREAADKVNTQTLPAYYKAKVAADEHLAALAKKRGQGFQAINLRPGTLTDDEGTGKVWLGQYLARLLGMGDVWLTCLRTGKTSARGKVTREDVARVAAALLERDDVQGWWDLLEGDDEIAPAVDKLAKEGWDAMLDGEDLNRIYAVA